MMPELKEGNALHQQVKDAIIELIKNGEYKPNSQLPTEAEFCDEYGVSRTTVRSALQQLSTEGYVYRKRGSGTFVSPDKVKQVLTTTVDQFTTQIEMQGKKPLIKVLKLEVVPADEYLADMLKIEDGEPVNMLERVRYVNEEPLQYEIAYLPWYKTPGLNQKACEESLYKLLETQFELKLSRTVESLELFTADEESADKLHVNIGDPCLSLDTVAYTKDGTIIEYSKTIFRGDLAHFVIERNYDK
ncbi:GntR family transcriptional regulator [Peribacillus deserti]|uniref:GntR family transcriptional regulator n=1 Tax=Peribacillus deserti TaxID=673318 RepID=A0ABS2QFW3_9BACI|nr:GntR family transcriptional regulator [Peribacillus deserti]MBM7692032.1 GntR family transcriptional regulator [Peribacillus deserti]